MGEDIPLIITADDFGYCTSRNNAIIALFTHHAISRTSLLVNGKAVHDAVKRAKHLQLPVGKIKVLCTISVYLFIFERH